MRTTKHSSRHYNPALTTLQNLQGSPDSQEQKSIHPAVSTPWATQGAAETQWSLSLAGQGVLF